MKKSERPLSELRLTEPEYPIARVSEATNTLSRPHAHVATAPSVVADG